MTCRVGGIGGAVDKFQSSSRSVRGGRVGGWTALSAGVRPRQQTREVFEFTPPARTSYSCVRGHRNERAGDHAARCACAPPHKLRPAAITYVTMVHASGGTVRGTKHASGTIRGANSVSVAERATQPATRGQRGRGIRILLNPSHWLLSHLDLAPFGATGALPTLPTHLPYVASRKDLMSRWLLWLVASSSVVPVPGFFFGSPKAPAQTMQSVAHAAFQDMDSDGSGMLGATTTATIAHHTITIATTHLTTHPAARLTTRPQSHQPRPSSILPTTTTRTTQSPPITPHHTRHGQPAGDGLQDF